MVTVRQKLALAKMVENGRSMGAAMIEAGYSENTAKAPTKLTTSKGWQALMQKHFPDSKLAALHKKLLDKKEVIVVSDGNQSGSHLEWTGQPHSDSLKALEVAYKIKGKLKEAENPQTTPHQTVIIINTPNGTSQNRVFTQPKTI